jgi:Uma2 family endonuclease
VPDSFVEFPLERAHHLARWQELVDDPELARWPGRVETDRLGRMIVSLIPALSHSFRQGDIFRALCDLLPGEALFACPLVTLDGVKVIDVAWIGPEYAARLESQNPVALERAPEICVEVLSPSNSKPEMEEKRALYFEAGAQEVWICGLDGKMEFYTADLSAASRLCPMFPGQL